MANEFNIDSFAEMSDEDFLSSSQLEQENTPTEYNEEAELHEESSDDGSVDNGAEEEEENSSDIDEEDSEEGSEDSEQEEEEGDESNEEDESEEQEKSDSTAEETLAKLFSPFVANGTEIKVDSVEEAITLMQMGANYHKKMHTLKPHLKLVKTLEKSKLLDEDKINFLIDLNNGEPKAIAKLLSEKGLDPLDINTEESNEYSPVKHTVSEQTINLDEVLDRIQHTPTFKDTMDVITNQWDSSSKEKLVAEPHKIEVLNAHKANGLFDRINAQVQKSRMLGQLPSGLSDVEAYEYVGSQLLQQEQANGTQTTPKKVVASKPKPKATADRTKLAAPKAKRKESLPSSIEELAELDDAAFLKLGDKKYF